MMLKIFVGIQLILLISSFTISQNVQDSLCTSTQLNAIYQSALQCEEGSKDDTIACIALSLQKATGSKWDIVSRESYNTQSAVSYENFQNKCNITLKDWGEWKRTYWIWNANQDMGNLLSQQCKGFNSTRKATIQRYIDQCQDANIQNEVNCIRNLASYSSGIWGAFVTTDTGRSNFRIYCAKDFGNNYDPCSYFRYYGQNKRSYLVWCENCVSTPDLQ